MGAVGGLLWYSRAMTEAEHFIGKVAQKAVIEKDGKVLVTRYPTDTEWDLPGGRIHRDEKPETGLAREIKEELGVDSEIGLPFFTDMFTGQDGDSRYFVTFRAQFVDPNQPFVLQVEEVAEVCWIGKNDVESKPLFEVCKRALEAYWKQNTSRSGEIGKHATFRS
jgi:8-oxo-dGTP pyrophosphatase MutT (NUDIX family)